MKLYKFRSLQQLEFVLDIVLNEKLYCAHFSSLNDPMEGLFIRVTHFPRTPFSVKSTEHASIKDVSELPEYDNRHRICSLSAEFKDIRLWSHYADGHRGVAIEIEFKGDESGLKHVEYLPTLETYGGSTVLGGPYSERILSQKTYHWTYEEEFRLLHSEAYYPINGLITAIYLGQRISEPHKALLDKVVPKKLPTISDEGQ